MENLLDGFGADDFDDIAASDHDSHLDVEDLEHPMDHKTFLLSASLPPLQIGFATGGGKKLAPPSAASLRKARKLLHGEETDEYPVKRSRIEENNEDGSPGSFPPLQASSSTPNQRQDALLPVSGFKTASGSEAPSFSADRASVLALLGEGNLPPLETPLRSASPYLGAGFTTAGGSQAPRMRGDRATAFTLFDGVEGTPMRPPLQSMTNTFATPRGKPFVTPKPTRRIGMGTPRSRPPFLTPFRAPAPANAKGEAVWKPVFDLHTPSDRVPMAAFFSGPPPNTAWPQLARIDSRSASAFSFGGSNGSTKALSALMADGCRHAEIKWVQNHWALIIWKLAGQVLAKPSLYHTWWTFGEVLRQLKYRYEREYGEAQRSIVRRVQERDSSASLPMVLCVSRIEPAAEQAYDVELSDGWYRIAACVDVKLSNAIKKGIIKVGRKLAISGARLSSTEAQSVLEATAKLMISANGCALARWDAKLGRHAAPFISNLSKLDVDGGVIPLMEVYIDKIFPIAYIRAGKLQNNAPWDETEEREQQDEWNDRYQNTILQLQEAKSKEMDQLRDVAEAIMSYADGIDCAMRDPPDSLEDDFDSLLEGTDLFKRIKAFSDQRLVHLARYAQIRLQREERDKQAEVEVELRTACPPRDVRDFRVIRVTDARTGNRPQSRIGLINVWDAKSLGDELREGGRYMVSNLTPGKCGQWHWPVRGEKQVEINLHTRRETRWKQM